ncbi:multidrug efflux RND transporter permease subunit [uncultured Muribaculum sp.]|uniref:multidrug efflux RND transporter permease subunit n=2 Tax=uncultured Muribaculum sp. TaxID=1918613 RepID=UPI0034A0B665
MKISFFIDRPVFSIVLSILIVILGFIGLLMLPIDQYPQITPPVVKISASYPGASALTVSQAVATPIEQELNGTPGMLYMESSSSNTGSFSATVTFDISASPELSAVEVQNRIKLAESRLPAEVVQNGISVEKQSPSQLMTICLQSSDPKFDEIYLSNFATLNVLDLLRRLPGVGRVSNIGSRYYAMQIWVQPDKLANLGITVADLQKALKDQNRESAAGVLGQQPVTGLDVTIPITTQGRLSSVTEFEDIVVRANPDGSLIRLRDVARISLEAQSYNTESGINNSNAAVLAIYMLPGANAMEVAEQVKNAMKEISANFPDGLTYEIPFDMTTYISESIHEVYKTLFEALVLVIFVVFLSLQSWRATLIPLIAVPISLIGTFGFMLIFGFSLNMLTLLGLVLAIGIVVDDAIVVVENVEHVMTTEGLTPYEATKKAMKGLTSPIIATSLVLAAVFVPVSFLPGITGLLYRQFTVTIVVSVLLSAVVALTLSPVMCSLILKPRRPGESKNIVFRTINRWIAAGNDAFVNVISASLKAKKKVLIGFGAMIGAILLINYMMPASFLPVEDQGYFKIEIELPEGATLERTRTVTDRAVTYLMENPAVDYVQSVSGTSSRIGSTQSRSELTVILKPWDKRDGQTIDQVMAQVSKDMSSYPECRIFLSKPPVIPGLGTAGGFELQLEARGDATLEDLERAVDTLMFYAQKRPEVSGLSSSLQTDIPQLYFDVDRDKVKFAGVPLADVFSTMKAYTGAVYVNDFNLFNRIYRVYLQAEAPYREHKENINLFFVRGNGDTMIPLTALGSSRYTTGPGNIRRFNMFNTALIMGDAAHGYSSGDAMATMEQIAKKHLPENIGVEWSGLSFQQKRQGGQTGLVLSLVFLFVFLFLAALYESWTVPLAVLLSLPVAALGAYLGEWVFGLENDVYFQIGLVMLMGMAAKNAILIVEFAKEQTSRGVLAYDAAVYAAKLRFRPILMTSLAFILGMLPMVLASGPGSASRQAIGTGVFFGMIFAVTIGIILVPFFFILIFNGVKKLQKIHLTKTGAAILALPLIFCLNSCKLGKAYSRPDIDIPQSIYAENKADTLSVADVAWWNIYPDPALQELIKKTLDNNNDLLASKARIKELAASRRIDKSQLLPQLNGNAYVQKEALNYGGDSYKNDPEIGLKGGISWEIDLWGNLRWAVEKGTAQYLEAVESSRALQVSLIADVASAYFELVALDNELRIVRRTLSARTEAAKIAKLRYEGGLTSETSYQQAQVELARTATYIPRLERDIALKESEISLICGEFPHDIIRTGTLSWYDKEPQSIPVGLSSELIERRPDVRAAEQKLKAANAAVGMAYTNRFPKLSLTAQGGLESEEFANFMRSPMYFLSAGILGPIFDGGKRQAQYRAGQAAYEQQTYAYRNTVIQAFTEARNAIINYRQTAQAAQSWKQLEQSSKTALDLAQLQYINGVVAYLNVLDAQRSYFDAQIGLSNATRDRHLSLISLYKALGGGWRID